MSTPSTPSAPAAPPSCYRHPGRGTYVSCTRCQRYICPDCMRSAAVGHQCVECVGEGAKSVPRVRSTVGGTPYVTYVLIAANVLMFILQKAVPGVYEQLVLWPVGIAGRGEWYRLATSAFLHADLMHILFNMWALWVIGPALERWLGRTRFIALYALGGLGGSVLVYLLTPINVPTLGASGAIFALFGATFTLARRLNFDVRWIVGLIVINLVITFVVPSISWQGHVGGLLTGAALGGVFAYAPRANRVLIETGFALTLLALFVALVWWRTSSILSAFG
ncbi:rhomboid family intramembrane serine protease [Mycolicibacterium sp.]|uniref:rhomboid family intramembrane serine protease n=1 Tax=Mycolicibacterium sp. TaxID=2320850 RepID=UPI001A32D6C8|nr:rhomboid family intramembrane serine protease [Mycolicibacterium sp.]MBJ7339357.1 rhomboid family intramembrane serine protease [Mycolicibacterium sp.]